MFRRFLDEGLAQSSYLVACDRTHTAVVVDPRRDIDEYVDRAGRLGLTITHAVETHIHADFVSGARELAARGATVVTGPGSDLAFPHEEAGHGTVQRIGDIEITRLHTPGHTPEHLSLLVREPGAPVRVLTGDTLFVGAVGRPDLLGQAATRRLAEQLHDSLFGTLLTLQDEVEVHPGHGAGSLCGAGIGSAEHSTIAQERRFNPLLQRRDKAEFVEAVLADLPETPSYFARMKRWNRQGPDVLGLGGGVAPPRTVDVRTAAEAVREGAWLIDLRSPADYGAGHVPGAVNLGFGAKLGYWAGWVIPADARVLLMMDRGDSDAAEVRRQLLRVGIDRVEGSVAGGFDAWRAAGLPAGRVPQIAAADLRAAPRPTIVDVRSPREWTADHIDGAVNIPVGVLLERAGELPRDGLLATICEGGYRSSLAASLLARQGFSNVANVPGGMNAWRGAAAIV